MSEKIKPADFWTHPEYFRGQGFDRYIDLVTPNNYFGYGHFSERIVEAIFNRMEQGASILELGCSVGRNLFYLQQAGYEKVTGVEINPESAKLARDWLSKFSFARAEIINSSIEEYVAQIIIPKFDVIFTQSVLMHIPPESDWIFEKMALHADKLIITHEIEGDEGLRGQFYWERNYQEVFEAFGMKQIEMTKYSPQILRVFKHEQK